MNFDFDDISPTRRAADRIIIGLIERVVSVFASHWLLILNLTQFSIVGVALLIPVMTYAGLDGIASTIFDGYHALCHQLPYRSDFLLGHQVAICQRDVAIYGSMALAGTAFARFRTSLRPLQWWMYLLLIIPIAVDGTTQLFGWRESNWELRTLTGVLFGASTVWLTYPHIQMAMRQLRESLDSRDMGNLSPS